MKITLTVDTCVGYFEIKYGWQIENVDLAGRAVLCWLNSWSVGACALPESGSDGDGDSDHGENGDDKLRKIYKVVTSVMRFV